MSLLTRIPVDTGSSDQEDLARAVPWFPVVGAVVGGLLAGTYAGLRVLLPPLVAAAATVGLGIVLTGAFHEDGLADASDALGARTRAEAFRILKDPTHGTFGVVAIVLSVLLRTGALATLDAWSAFVFLPSAHALSRGASAVLVGLVPPAAEGLGASYAAVTSRRAAASAAIAGLVIGVFFAGPWAFPAALGAAVAAASVGAAAVRRLGGITGDMLGAAQQVGEVLVLMTGAAAAAHGTSSLPWWR